MTNFKQGFTLIEILLVIVVIAALAVAIGIFIDPLDKINSANDSKVQSDISQIARAMEAYAVANGNYPTGAGPLVASGELKLILLAPAGYDAYSYAPGGLSQSVCGQQKSKKYTAYGILAFAWCSISGKIGTVINCGDCP